MPVARMLKLAIAIFGALLGTVVQAHMFVPVDNSAPFNPWHLDPFAVALLCLVAFIYWRGSLRSPQRTGLTLRRWRRRQQYFWLGWTTLAVALASPLDPLGEELFSAHMVQHELMMLIAAPLLVLSRPSSALLRGLTGKCASVFGRVTRRSTHFWSFLSSPSSAWIVHAVGLWGWHIPVLFNSGLENTGIHALQHLSFLFIGLLFWYALVKRRQINAAVGVLYLFTTAVHASLLGALLTFSPEVWYQPYLRTAPGWGLTALEDQQLGGLIMWMPAGVVFVAAGLWSLAHLLRTSDSGTLAQNDRSSNRGRP